MTHNNLEFIPNEITSHFPFGVETPFNPVVPTNPDEPTYHFGGLPWEGNEA